nr:macrophage migration inhibitory factor homolog [Ipomoea batatas]
MEMENDVDWLAGKIEVEPDCEEDNTDVVDGILIVKLSQAWRKELNVHGISLDVWSLLTWVVVVVLPVLNLRRTANTCSWMDFRNFSTITPKMPTLSLFTNVSVNAVVASDILKDATEAVAKIIGKPESYVMIVLNESVPIAFAGTEALAAYGELMSIGGLVYPPRHPAPKLKNPNIILYSKALRINDIWTRF